MRNSSADIPLAHKHAQALVGLVPPGCGEGNRPCVVPQCQGPSLGRATKNLWETLWEPRVPGTFRSSKQTNDHAGNRVEEVEEKEEEEEEVVEKEEDVDEEEEVLEEGEEVVEEEEELEEAEEEEEEEEE
ncbi:unnamed protein product [Gadus morhua 'NCC']